MRDWESGWIVELGVLEFGVKIFWIIRFFKYVGFLGFSFFM